MENEIYPDLVLKNKKDGIMFNNIMLLKDSKTTS